MTFRDPKFFLIVLIAFILGSMFAHTQFAYDSDFGLTNMILSIEASTASAVLMMVAERTAAQQDEMARVQREQLATLIEMAQLSRQSLQDQVDLLREIRANDQMLLEFIRGQK